MQRDDDVRVKLLDAADDNAEEGNRQVGGDDEAKPAVFGWVDCLVCIATQWHIPLVMICLAASVHEASPALRMAYMLSYWFWTAFLGVSLVYLVGSMIAGRDIDQTLTSFTFVLMAASCTWDCAVIAVCGAQRLA